MSFVASASDRTGKPTWWIDEFGPVPRWLGVCIVMLAPAVVIASKLFAPRFVVPAQFFGVALIAVSAAADSTRAPGASAVEFLIAVAAFLGSIATLAGLPLDHVQSAHIAPEG